MKMAFLNQSLRNNKKNSNSSNKRRKTVIMNITMSMIMSTDMNLSNTQISKHNNKRIFE